MQSSARSLALFSRVTRNLRVPLECGEFCVEGRLYDLTVPTTFCKQLDGPCLSLVLSPTAGNRAAVAASIRQAFSSNLRGFAASASQGTAGSQTVLERTLPSGLVPYAQLIRLDKPIGTWLLAWPCFWSIALATPPGAFPDLKLLTLFGAGALLLRGAGCTVNDLWDRDLDRQVDRTKNRPLAAGTLSTKQAVVFLGAQLAAGLGILVQLNEYSIVLGASSLALVFTYPVMKRITFWPQAFLGLTFNWGALLGWAAVQGSCDWLVVLPLYAGGVCWTLVYDTIYAYQDKDDDTLVGIKSTALRFAARPRLWLSAFAAAQVALFGVSGWSMDMGLPFYAGLGGVAGHLAWQIGTVDLNRRQDCLAKFKSNRDLGAVMFFAILLSKLITQYV